MSLRRMRIYLVVSVLVAVAGLGATFASSNEPVLGLDLQGGISVVLAPVGKFKPSSLDVAVDIIRNRVDSLGVAEPEISRQGDNIVVDLPGVKDREKARRLVGRTAELRFRPVLGDVPAAGATVTTSTVAGATTTAPSGATTTGATTSTTTSASDAAAKAAIASCDPTQVQALLSAGTNLPTTSLADNARSACVVLPERSGTRLYLGPTALTGKAVSGADSKFAQGQGYTVSINFTNAGSSQWDTLGQKYFHQAVAIELDGVVQSAPVIQPDNQAFQSFGGSAQISGGQSGFSPSEASDLATIINYGALPVQLKQLTVENVSPSLGSDQLDAGLAAGVIGLLLVALYMILYYRLLGAVAIAGLLMSGGITYALISYLGNSIGLTLTLAGVTGLIVSVGITVDSYVVYFERLKDEVKTGKTVRSSVDRGFVRSFKTIVAADLVSLIGAAVLYFLAIGSVRGFAFYLGLSTILDLLVSYFFMHPLVSLMARRPQLVRMRGVGIAAGLDAPGVTA